MNVVQTILDKDGSAPKCGVQAGLANERVVLDSYQDERRRRLACVGDETGVEE